MMKNGILTALTVTLTVFIGLYVGSQSASAETYHFNLGDAFNRLVNSDKSKESEKGHKSNQQVNRGSERSTNQATPASSKLPASWKIEETIVGPAPDAGNIYWLSPKGMHLAVVYMKGSRFVVSIDGVEGDKFNEILHTAVGVEEEYDSDGIVRRVREKWKVPVAFSPDGSRYAYAARQGKEAVVILDGKEIFRAPYKKAIPPTIRDSVSMLSFTPDGEHLFFYEGTGRLMMDGQPVTPKLKGMPWPFFSADGSSWGLFAEPSRPFNAWNNYEGSEPFMSLIKKYIKQSDEAHREAIYIDGKEVDYICQHPRFTLDGKHVACIQKENSKDSLLLDGVPLMTVNRIKKLVLSPNGSIAVIDGKHRLYIDGKPASGGEDVWDMTFSPDGNHWAAVVRSHPAAWVVADGKKQLDYDNVSDVKFSPDSSTLVYIAKVGKKKFVVANGEEGHGSDSINSGPMFGKIGNHVTYSVNDLNAPDRSKRLKVYHDGKAGPYSRSVSKLTVSPDGARHAYNAMRDALNGRLTVDGEIKGRNYAFNPKILFSPDSQHVATISTPLTKRGRKSVYHDGKFISIPKGISYVKVLGFSSDSRHLLTKGSRRIRKGSEVVYFLDGKRIANFHFQFASGLSQRRHRIPLLAEPWEMQPDGSVVVIGHVPIANNNGGVVKRIKISPERQAAIKRVEEKPKVKVEQIMAQSKEEAAQQMKQPVQSTGNKHKTMKEVPAKDKVAKSSQHQLKQQSKGVSKSESKILDQGIRKLEALL